MARSRRLQKADSVALQVVLRRLAEIGAVQFDPLGVPLAAPVAPPKSAAEMAPLVRYSTTERSEAAAQLQRALNRFPGVFLRVDGIPGQRTSGACKRVIGHYLTGDPRLNTPKSRGASGSR
jgi:hypothetical protein